MSKTLYWVIVFLIVVILGVSFYWFQWRPSKIKKECSKYPDTTTTSVKTYDGIGGGSSEKKETTNPYVDCLHKNGLK